MGCKPKKYLHIHDWNYWWGYYRCGQDWEPFHAAEFDYAGTQACLALKEEALLRGDLSPGGEPPHSGGADALGGDSVPAPIRPAVFLHACTSSQPAGGDGAV